MQFGAKIQKYVLLFIWTRRVSGVHGVNQTQWKINIHLNGDSPIRNDIYRINGFDIDFVSNNHLHYTTCTAHQTANTEQTTESNGICLACVHAANHSKYFTILFRFTSVAVIYWFIEMALIFERNANLQFYTFDKLRKLTAWFIRHKYKYINQLTRVFVYFIFFYRILFSTLIFESINERKSAFIWFCFLRKQIGFVNEFKLYQLMSSHYRP